MNVTWSSRAWADYRHWQAQDAKLVMKINALIEDARRSPSRGLGKPEPLKGSRVGWSPERRWVEREGG